MTGVYLSADAVRLVRAARASVDEHALDAATERCRRCGVLGPCPTRRDALALLDSYGRLPYRRPGATRPEGIGALSPRPAVGRHRRPEL